MAPVLIPDVAQGAAGELDGLRAACRSAIRRADAPGRQWVVLGPGPVSRSFGSSSRGTFAGFGVPLEVGLGSDELGPVELPLSLTVGAWLLRDTLGPGCGALGYAIADLGTEDDYWDGHDGDVVVLVMGDGSARRSVKAPGYFDERAEGVDAYVAATLRHGFGDRLHRELVDGDDQLLMAGLNAWDLLSWSVEPFRWNAELLYDGAPYGVGYFVASWQLDRASVRG